MSDAEPIVRRLAACRIAIDGLINKYAVQGAITLDAQDRMNRDPELHKLTQEYGDVAYEAVEWVKSNG